MLAYGKLSIFFVAIRIFESEIEIWRKLFKEFELKVIWFYLLTPKSSFNLNF